MNSYNIKLRNGILFFILTFAINEQTLYAQKKRLCFGGVQVNPAVVKKAGGFGSMQYLEELSQALHTVIENKIQGSQKFTVIPRGAGLQVLLENQDWENSGNVDFATAANQLQMSGSDYVAIVTISDFQSVASVLKFRTINASGKSYQMRISASLIVYNSTTGERQANASFSDVERSVEQAGVLKNKSVTTKLADRVGSSVVMRIVDEIYPAKILRILGNQVTINRGDSAGVFIGDRYTVFALGEALIDPDTGESLGSDEYPIGELVVTRVTTKLSYGDKVDDQGIEVGNVLRKIQPKKSASGSKKFEKPRKSLIESLDF
jgi:hypothetical protein